ncbi:DUF3429 domain-containing protein [Idiomarina tyrosinivorans]|uniref:DUF3429 domain-containing protein n=1 Tax=Idiomarina tyrosinivorans TaxID=1445662 RepID=A0A432ZUF8_9GAMM|nr:DUF3429 domain-containing protein [Idiomarina tyrosinivorans]RUO81523.1 DUF3429 domain-containing protein [Idiomarina tyrosinivorans]
MTSYKNRWIMGLGAAGLIPFIGLALCQLMDTTVFNLAMPYAFVTYGAIILSFLSGTLWGRALHYADQEQTQVLIVLSNVFSLAAWLSLLLDSMIIGLWIQIVGYLAVLFFEKRLIPGSIMSDQASYYPLRLVLTIAVVVCELFVVIDLQFPGTL